MSPWGKYTYPIWAGGGSLSKSVDQKFSFGFGAFGEYRVLKYMAVGGNFVFWLPKAKDADKRDKAWGFLPYVKGVYPINDTFAPYVTFEFGVSQWIPSEGKNSVNVPIGGGVGCEFNFGSFGAFLGLDYLYHIGVTDLGGTLEDEGGSVSYSKKLRWSSLAINLGAQYNF